MTRTKYLIWTVLGPLVALTLASEPARRPIPTDIPQPVDQLPPGMKPATDAQMREAMRDVTRNPRPSIEERLQRIERLSAQIQQEAGELRQDLHLPPAQTQPAVPADGKPIPSVHFR